MVLGAQITTLNNSSSLDDCTTIGLYEYKTINPSIEGIPTGLTLPFIMEVKGFANSPVRLQVLYEVGGYHCIYIRNYSNAQSKWLEWDKFTGVRLT